MSCQFVISGLLFISLVYVLTTQVDGTDFGTVTCTGKSVTASPKLMASFVKAKCDIPKDPNEEAIASVGRCIYRYVKAFTPPNKWNKAKADSEIGGAFPAKYQASFKTKQASCLSASQKTMKSEKDDKTGKTWVPFLKCLGTWYKDVLCQ